MAVRTPVYWDTSSGSMKEMTTAMVNQIIAQVSYQHSLNPPITLSYVSANGGNLYQGTLADTRLQAGAASTSTTAFPAETTTAEPSTVTVNHRSILQSTASVSVPGPASGRTLPLYFTGSDLKVFSDDDFYNTFIEPAMTNLTSASTSSAQGGTYRIHTSTSLAGHTLMSTSPVFVDTRADTSLYTAAGITETLDQPKTITNFYLFRIESTASAFTAPLSLRTADNNLQVYTDGEFNTMLQDYVRYAVVNRPNYRFRYSISRNTTTDPYMSGGVVVEVGGNVRGSGMTDTKLNGSGAYTQSTVYNSGDDYRAQEFPNGTAQVQNTYYLRIFRF